MDYWLGDVAGYSGQASSALLSSMREVRNRSPKDGGSFTGQYCHTGNFLSPWIKVPFLLQVHWDELPHLLLGPVTSGYSNYLVSDKVQPRNARARSRKGLGSWLWNHRSPASWGSFSSGYIKRNGKRLRDGANYRSFLFLGS